jgi:hypothetical protein
MSGFIPKEKLTAYQRWEVAAFDEVADADATKRRAQANGSAGQEEESDPAALLPTAEDIERIHNEAHQPATQPVMKPAYAAARVEADTIASAWYQSRSAPDSGTGSGGRRGIAWRRRRNRWTGAATEPATATGPATAGGP